MNLIKEIQNQSPATRKLIFGLCVIATVAFVGRVWFESFQKDVYTALNPSIEESVNIAEDTDNPLEVVLGSLNSLRALISDAFSGTNSVELKNEIEYTQPTDEVYSPLPLSPLR